MPKQTKNQKRKAKLKERKRHAENAMKERINGMSRALEILCEPIIPTYLDKNLNLDLEGYRVAYTVGLYAWNICVSGIVDLTRMALHRKIYNQEKLAIVENDIGKLISRKYELYPNVTTSILNVTAVIINGVPHARVRLGKTFEPRPRVIWDKSSHAISDAEIADLRKKMKLTQVKFGELFGVTARKISEWEHGKSTPSEAQIIALNEQKKKL